LPGIAVETKTTCDVMRCDGKTKTKHTKDDEHNVGLLSAMR
jgi:hypothetical protein